jgi:hypothetical protein
MTVVRLHKQIRSAVIKVIKLLKVLLNANENYFNERFRIFSNEIENEIHAREFINS